MSCLTWHTYATLASNIVDIKTPPYLAAAQVGLLWLDSMSKVATHVGVGMSTQFEIVSNISKPEDYDDCTGTDSGIPKTAFEVGCVVLFLVV
jgi:hypothetical protein